MGLCIRWQSMTYLVRGAVFRPRGGIGGDPQAVKCRPPYWSTLRSRCAPLALSRPPRRADGRAARALGYELPAASRRRPAMGPIAEFNRSFLVGSGTARRMAIPQPGCLQNSDRDGGCSFPLFVADPRTVRSSEKSPRRLAAAESSRRTRLLEPFRHVTIVGHSWLPRPIFRATVHRNPLSTSHFQRQSRSGSSTAWAILRSCTTPRASAEYRIPQQISSARTSRMLDLTLLPAAPSSTARIVIERVRSSWRSCRRCCGLRCR
jgi:hypothetical protein